MHVFRTDHLIVDNLSGAFSLQKTDSLLAAIDHVGAGPCEISPIQPGMSPGVVTGQVFLSDH